MLMCGSGCGCVYKSGIGCCLGKEGSFDSHYEVRELGKEGAELWKRGVRRWCEEGTNERAIKQYDQQDDSNRVAMGRREEWKNQKRFGEIAQPRPIKALIICLISYM